MSGVSNPSRVQAELAARRTVHFEALQYRWRSAISCRESIIMWSACDLMKIIRSFVWNPDECQSLISIISCPGFHSKPFPALSRTSNLSWVPVPAYFSLQSQYLAIYPPHALFRLAHLNLESLSLPLPPPDSHLKQFARRIHPGQVRLTAPRGGADKPQWFGRFVCGVVSDLDVVEVEHLAGPRPRRPRLPRFTILRNGPTQNQLPNQ